MRQLVLEVGTIGVLFLLYRHVRVVVRHHQVQAFHNSTRVVSFERAAGFFTEVQLQRFMVHDHAAMWILDRYYVIMHFTTTVIVLLWAFIWYRTTTYRRL